jgi:signal transduction histidine kinase
MSTAAVTLAEERDGGLLASSRVRWAVGATGILVGCLVALVPYLSARDAPVSDYADKSGPAIAAHVAVGMSFILVGLLAWSRRPTNRVGALMTLTGFTYFLTDLGWIDTPATFIFADEWRGLSFAMLFWLLLAFPSGRLDSRLDRIYIVCFFAWVGLVRPFPSAAFFDPTVEGPFDVPENPLLVRADADLNTTVDRWLSLIDLIFIALMLVLLVRHWRRAGRYGRRALVPVLAVSGVMVVTLLVGYLLGYKSQQSLTWGVQLMLAALPLGFLVGLMRSRLARAGVADLVLELRQTQAPAQVRDALSRALDDPTLEVGYWLAATERYVDADGAVVDTAKSAERTATFVSSEGEPVAVLVHDASLADEPDLVAAVAATAQLALENQRLHAEVRAQLDEVRASRARIVAAGDAERRRLERDLHDGAQQRLLALGLALQLARSELGDQASATDELLVEAEAELQEALVELRELARGIHPAILTDGGLAPALQTLAERAPVPVSVSAVQGRLPPAVETAAYFVVSEALANVAKHAQATRASVGVGVHGDRAVVVVEDDGVGGAEPGVGSGLGGLRDRVQAIGGSLSIDSETGAGTTIRAELPCA